MKHFFVYNNTKLQKSRRMSERSAIFNTETFSKKSRGEHSQENSKGNIFRQKPKAEPSPSRSLERSNRPVYKNTSNKNPNQRNGFQYKSSKVKPREFNMDKCMFPDLVKSIVIADKDPVVEDSYMSKIQKFRESNLVTETVPRGWIILSKATSKKYKPKTLNPENERNPYYNVWNARAIIKNRQKYREELNDILGDISPYWNMKIYAMEDQEEYDEPEYSDDDGEDSVEEW